MNSSENRFSGALYLTGARFLGIFLSFIAVPLYYRFIGEDGYNVVIFAAALMPYVSLLDLGLTYSVNLRTTEAAHHKDRQTTVKILQTGFGLVWPFGLAGTALLVGFGAAYGWLQPDNPIGRYPMAYWLIGLTVLFTTLSMLLSSLLLAHERYKISTVLRIVNSILLTALPLLLCWSMRSPYGHFSGSLVAAIATFGAYAIVGARIVHWSLLRPKVDRMIARDLVKTGWGMLALRLPGAVTLSVDRLVVGTLYDRSAVDDFSVPTRVPEQMQGLYRSTIDPLFPTFAKANQNEPEGLYDALGRFGPMLLAGAVVAIVIPCAFAQQILDIWVPGQLTSVSVIVMQTMAWFHLLDTYYTIIGFAAMAKGKASALVGFTTFSAVSRLIAAPISLSVGANTALGPLPTLALVNVAISAIQFVPLHICVLREVSSAANPWNNMRRALKILAFAGAVFAGAVWTSGALRSLSPWIVAAAIPAFQAAFIWLILATKSAPIPDAMTERLRRYGLVRR